jgi:hypothetical protein
MDPRRPEVDPAASSMPNIPRNDPPPLDLHERIAIGGLFEAIVDALDNPQATSLDHVQRLASFLRGIAASASPAVVMGNRASTFDGLTADLDAFVRTLESSEPS